MTDDFKSVPPPYGPTEGMLQGIELMHRLSPTKVDAKLLKTNGVAPGNEYKVVGALKYLNIIDEDGKPTTKSRLLKTRGPSYLLALQDIVKTAYKDVFSEVDMRTASKNQIHNYFVTDLGLGIEMAVKASRFFISLCQQADLSINPDLITARDASASDVKKSVPAAKKRLTARKRETFPESPLLPLSPTFVLAITPETAAMGLDELTALFKKINRAMKLASAEE
ncbi:DUF5343 domain-containing protein [Chloroflexota bacterium]